MFNLFSPAEPSTIAATVSTAPDDLPSESIRLTEALYLALRALPNASNGSEDIDRFCQIILKIAPRLRLIWVGFSVDQADALPHAVIGACLPETAEWRLPHQAFDRSESYLQVNPWISVGHPDNSFLFAPWLANPAVCSASCALALPMQGEKNGPRGMVVFYADRPDYFSVTGKAPFQAFCDVMEVIWRQSNLMHLLSKKSKTDGLTGLMNRRKTTLMIEQAIAHSEQSRKPFSIMRCRIADFDRINDLYGWSAADAILSAFAKMASSRMRPGDLAGRWNGTEFVFLFPSTRLSDARAIAESFAQHFEREPIRIDKWSIRLVLRIGAAEHRQGSLGASDLLRQAAQSSLPAPGSDAA